MSHSGNPIEEPSGIPTDAGGDDTQGDYAKRAWMTYQDIAEGLGINVASARRRAFRAGWERRAGNDGLARVAVPNDVIAEMKPRHSGIPMIRRRGRPPKQASNPSDEPMSNPSDELSEARVSSAHAEAAVRALRETVARLDEEGSWLRTELDDVRQRLASAEAAKASIETAKAVAEAKLQALEAEVSRRRASWLGRLLGW